MKSLFVDSHTHLGKANRKAYSIQELETSMNQANIDISIVIADRTSGKLATNDYLATLSKNNSKIRVVADISSKEFNDEGFQKIYNFLNHDFVGVKLYPGYENFFPYDERIFPLYDLCTRLSKPVIFHTGVLQAGYTGLLKQLHPLNTDEVATRFPKLKIVMAHSGNPWLFDCASVVAKNKNVYADISGYFNEFVDAIKGGAIPAEFISSIEKGVKEAMENGILLGFPMIDVKTTVYDGSYHEVDSSDIAFKIAASQALQAASKKAELTLIEPIMKVEVTTPSEFLGDVIGDLSAKRAQIMGTEERSKATIILAMAPLAELSGYATTLRSMSKGRASYYMEPSHYEEVPKNIQEQMLAKSTFTGRVSSQQ